MKFVDGFIEMTWKETIEHSHGVRTFPRWQRFLAPLQHWYACAFRGHRYVDLNKEFPSAPISRSIAPRCNFCFGPVGKCACELEK